VEEEIPVVRGRLLVQKQILKRFGRIDRLECRYDEYLTDTVENRILLAALAACAKKVGQPRQSYRQPTSIARVSDLSKYIKTPNRRLFKNLSGRKNGHLL